MAETKAKDLSIWVNLVGRTRATEILVPETATVSRLLAAIKSALSPRLDAFMAVELEVWTPDAAGTELTKPEAIVASVLQPRSDGTYHVYVVPPLEALENPTSRQVFVSLLNRHPQAGRAQVPNELFDVMENQFLAKFQYVLGSNDPERAYDLFLQAQKYPKRTTLSALLKNAKLQIAGLLTDVSKKDVSLFCANDTGGKLLVVKQLHVSADEKAEVECCEELKLHTMTLQSPQALVPTRVQAVHIRDDDDDEPGKKPARRRSINVLVMPRFPSSLTGNVMLLDAECLVVQTKRIVGALNFIHNANKVHMDVKGDNIFVSSDGDWYLGDFGSCVRVGDPIKTFTKEWHWDCLRQGETLADYRYDWGMLAVCVLIQARVAPDENGTLLPAFHEFKSLMSSNNNNTTGGKTDLVVDLGKVERGIVALPSIELAGLLSRILHCSAKTFNP